MSLRFGIAAREITPPLGLPMGGYAARTGVAAGVLDPLFCRAVVVADGVSCLVLVGLDLVWVAGDWAGAVRQRVAGALGCGLADVLIAATHTHAGPAVFHSAVGGADAMHAYEGELAEIVMQTVRDAHAVLQPATLAVGEAAVEGVAANRRVSAGNVDDCVRVVVARAGDDHLVGALAVFGCHPTVLPAANLSYSPDLFGVAVEVAQDRLGVPVLLLNGAAADVSTRFARREQSAAELQRLGQLLGDGIARAARESVPIAGAPLHAEQETIATQPRCLPTVEAAEALVAEAASRLADAKARGAAIAEERLEASRLEGALAQLFFARHGGADVLLGRPADRAVIQLLRVGECDIVGVPGELFSGVGAQIRAAGKGRVVLVVGYANDYLGYFVPAAEVAAGGYEALMAFVEPASADRLAARLEGFVRSHR